MWVMLDPAFTILPLQNILRIFPYITFFLKLICFEQPIFSDKSHIHPSMDEYCIGYVKSSNIVLGLVTKIVYTFILTSLHDFLSKYDYFLIHMDFVILYGSTE
jgi:hypothetical protein